MSEQEQSSLWKRLRRLLGGKERPASGEETSASTPRATAGDADESPATSPEEGEEAFAPQGLRDRVVVMLLFDETVRVEQVAAAWYHWRDDATPTPDTLWRVVALLDGVDRAAVYAEAARVYAFLSIDFNMYSARALIRKHRRRFSHEQWRRMVALNLAPVQRVYDKENDGQRWVFATHDPARPAAKRFLARQMSDEPHVLRFAPQQPLEEVFDDALPRLARERPESRVLPQMSVGEDMRREGRRFVEQLAPGATDEAQPFSRSGESKGGGDGAARGSSVLTPAQLFDDVLTGLLKNSGHAAYLLAGKESGQLEIHHRRYRRFNHWRTEPRLAADVMVDFASGHILSLRQSESQPENTMERWVAGRLVSFRLSLEPARALAEHVPVEKGTEAVVVELVR